MAGAPNHALTRISVTHSPRLTRYESSINRVLHTASCAAILGGVHLLDLLFSAQLPLTGAVPTQPPPL